MGQDWGKEYGDNWNEISEHVKKRDSYTCKSCGVRGRKYGPAELHAHHIHHKSEGGSDNPSNLVTLCWRCHNEAHDHFVQPMTEKARTNRASISAISSQTQDTTDKKWKISDGPADENLQRIANDIYESDQGTTQKHRYDTEETVSSKTTKTRQLLTIDQNDAVSAEDYTAHGFSTAFLIIGSPIIFILFLLMGQSFIHSALIVILLSATIYPFLYKWNKPIVEDLHRIDELLDPYEGKKKQINKTLKQDGKVSDRDIKELKEIHKDILEIFSRTSNMYFSEEFVVHVELTTSHIKQLEEGDFTS